MANTDFSTVRRALGPALLVASLLLGVACSDDSSPGDPDVMLPEMGQDAAAADAAPPDLQPPDLLPPDTQPCTAPFIADCVPACSAGDICSEAQGGRCAPLLGLSGKPDSTQVLVALVTAMANCWEENFSATADRSVLCTALQTCTLQGPVTEKMVKDWVCGPDAASSLPAQVNSTARQMHNCDAVIGIYRPVWKVAEIGIQQRGLVCLSYHHYSSALQAERLDVELCRYFRPFD